MTQEPQGLEESSALEAHARARKRYPRVGIVLVLIGVYVMLALLSETWNPISIVQGLAQNLSGADMPLSFDGDSQKLSTTQIVPTLDTPIENGKNVIWCATFTAGWKKAQEKVTKGPLLIAGAEEMCARLNGASAPGSTMPPEAFYANAGLFEDGIVQTVRREMEEKFPSHRLPAFEEYNAKNAFMFYSYLKARVPFTVHYVDNPKPLEFSGGDGVKTPVRSFGIRPDYGRLYRIQEQPQILMARWRETPDTPGGMLKLESYAVDLCRDSVPYQIVAARVERKESLGATLTSLEQSIQEFRKGREHASMAGGVLQVPGMAWRLVHHYRELEERPFKNAGFQDLCVVIAQQDIQFRLDKTGAQIDSESLEVAASATEANRENRFEFDGPFLLYIKTRGDAAPFFVMWVDNSELLKHWDS